MNAIMPRPMGVNDVVETKAKPHIRGKIIGSVGKLTWKIRFMGQDGVEFVDTKKSSQLRRPAVAAAAAAVEGVNDESVEKEEDKEQQKKEADLKWRNCEAKELLYMALVVGTIPLDDEGMGWEEVLDFFKENHPAAFANVGQSKFKERLSRLREKVVEKNDRSERDLAALRHDRAIFPRPTYNNRGVPYWPDSEAKPLLSEDIDSGKMDSFKKEKHPKKALWKSRPEYQVFTLRTFRKKVYQELKSRKFMAYIKHKRGNKFNPHESAASLFYTDTHKDDKANATSDVNENAKAAKDENESNNNHDSSTESKDKSSKDDEATAKGNEIEKDSSEEISSSSEEYRSTDPDVLAAEKYLEQLRLSKLNPRKNATEEDSSSSSSESSSLESSSSEEQRSTDPDVLAAEKYLEQLRLSKSKNAMEKDSSSSDSDDES